MDHDLTLDEFELGEPLDLANQVQEVNGVPFAGTQLGDILLAIESAPADGDDIPYGDDSTLAEDSAPAAEADPTMPVEEDEASWTVVRRRKAKVYREPLDEEPVAECVRLFLR